eukprot:510457-Amphidinium_carterae.1
MPLLRLSILSLICYHYGHSFAAINSLSVVEILLGDMGISPKACVWENKNSFRDPSVLFRLRKGRRGEAERSPARVAEEAEGLTAPHPLYRMARACAIGPQSVLVVGTLDCKIVHDLCKRKTAPPQVTCVKDGVLRRSKGSSQRGSLHMESPVRGMNRDCVPLVQLRFCLSGASVMSETHVTLYEARLLIAAEDEDDEVKEESDDSGGERQRKELMIC